MVDTLALKHDWTTLRESPLIRRRLRDLAQRDLIEGQGVSITYRWGAGDYRRLPELASDLA